MSKFNPENDGRVILWLFIAAQLFMILLVVFEIAESI